MRIIKFRGKRVGDSVWVFGDLKQDKGLSSTELYDRITISGYPVDDRTVGQFTGLFDKDGEQGSYVPSAWDNRFILNMSGTYNFPKHWSLGAKVSGIGGSPYTPYDVENLRWWKLGMCRDVLTMIIAAIIRSVCRSSDNWMCG